MPDSYITVAELRAYGYQSQTADETLMTAILPRASRLFDRAVGVKAGYFAAGSASQEPSARKFWGDGTDYLQIDPYLSSPAISVAMPDGFDVPTYIESRSQGHQVDDGQGFYLIRTYGDNESRIGAMTQLPDNMGAAFALDLTRISPVGWPIGIKVTVTAEWGWDAVPEDVKEAVLEIGIAIWRGRDQAFSRVVNLETNIQVVDALPSRAKLIADRYRQQRGMFA